MSLTTIFTYFSEEHPVALYPKTLSKELFGGEVKVVLL